MYLNPKLTASSLRMLLSCCILSACLPLLLQLLPLLLHPHCLRCCCCSAAASAAASSVKILHCLRCICIMLPSTVAASPLLLPPLLLSCYPRRPSRPAAV
jgi:hypothetical protein